LEKIVSLPHDESVVATTTRVIKDTITRHGNEDLVPCV